MAAHVGARDLAAVSLGRRLADLLGEIRHLPGFEPLGRIAVALYDERRDMLCSYAHAGQSGDLLDRHEYLLEEVPSLAILAGGDQPRVVDDIKRYGRDDSPHTSALRHAGFRSSLTVPVHSGASLAAFIFYNALEPGFFRAEVVRTLLPLSAGLVTMVRRHAL
jgi:hypothetical protein